ncbi:MAG: glutamate ligase domain-containing protein [Alistipes indistinctus]
MLRILSDLTSVDGRFEPIHSKEGVTAIVDYAHTPDALQNVIGTINEIRKKDQRPYVVVGCGGNRDATKRPEMAKIAVDGSDMAVLTSDNPRLEEPGANIEQSESPGWSRCAYPAMTDRREAIKAAVAPVRPGDIILVAGKGHETYQDRRRREAPLRRPGGGARGVRDGASRA